MFCSIWVHLGLFGCLTRCKTGRTGAQVRATKLSQNFSKQTQPIRPHWTLNSCFCAFHTIWVHLGLFGCVTTLSLKRVKLVQKFGTRSRVRIFRNERTRPHHWTLNSCSGAFHTNFGAFGTVWLARKNSVQNGPTGAKVRATKSHRNFTQRVCAIKSRQNFSQQT